MPNLTVNIPHQLGRAEAKKRVEELIADLQRNLGGMSGTIDERWTGDTLDFRLSVAGSQVTGQVFVEDQLARVEVALPWFLAALANGVKQRVEKEGQLLLGQRAGAKP